MISKSAPYAWRSPQSGWQKIDKRRPLDEAAVLSILQKEIKSRQEAIEDARRANRPDLGESSS